MNLSANMKPRFELAYPDIITFQKNRMDFSVLNSILLFIK